MARGDLFGGLASFAESVTVEKPDGRTFDARAIVDPSKGLRVSRIVIAETGAT